MAGKAFQLFNYVYLILNTIANRERKRVSMKRHRYLRYNHDFNYFFGEQYMANSVIDFFTCK